MRVAHPFVCVVGGLPPDLLTAMRGICKTVEDIDLLLSLLEKHSYVRPQLGNRDGGAGRKSSPTYEVNPDVGQTTDDEP